MVTERKVKKAIRLARNYDEWLEAAAALDRLKGLDRWRRADHSRQYDYVSIRTRLDQLRHLKARDDNRGLLYALNEGIHGNMGGMGQPGLYAHALSGTKHLIEQYIDEVVHTLEFLHEETSGDISFDEKQDFFNRASHCFGHSALMLSGAGSLLYFHIGVVRALLQADLLPEVISGSSGGAIVGAIVCSAKTNELTETLQPDFLIEQVSDSAQRGGVADPVEMELQLSRFLPDDLTFQRAFERSGRAINVSIAAAETHQTSRLMNATTSPSVLVRSAVMASAAVPGVFPPVTLAALDEDGALKSFLPARRWVDGSVSDDMPAKRLARLYGVNHYIVSQTNPAVLPFVGDGLRKKTALGLLQNAAVRSAREWFNATTMIIDRADTANGRITQATSMMRSIVNQDYTGDINILPDYRWVNPARLLGFPGKRKVKKLIAAGERCTWPKLEMVKQQTRISRCLRRIMRNYAELPVV